MTTWVTALISHLYNCADQGRRQWRHKRSKVQDFWLRQCDRIQVSNVQVFESGTRRTSQRMQLRCNRVDPGNEHRGMHQHQEQRYRFPFEVASSEAALQVCPLPVHCPVKSARTPLLFCAACWLRMPSRLL